MNDTDSDSAYERRRRAMEALPPLSREESEGTLRVVRAFRGLTIRQAIGYLESLGGRPVDETTVEGDHWSARLDAERQAVGPSYRLTTVTIEWTGDPETVEDIVTAFRLRAFRAPG